MCVCVCVCFFVFVFVCVSKFVCAQLADHQVSPRVRVEMMWAFEIVAPDKNDIVAPDRDHWRNGWLKVTWPDHLCVCKM